MKINELYELHSKFVNSQVDKSQWKRKGIGQTASVWQHMEDPDTVVKLVGGGKERYLKPGQKNSSIAFAHFCVDHGHESKHLPIILGLNVDDPQVVQIRIERLFSIPRQVGFALNNFAHRAKNIYVDPSDDVDRLNTILLEYKMRKNNDADDIRKMIKMLVMYAFEYSQRFDVPRNITVDLHEGNWMKRADGTIVAVDPWYSS